MNIKEYRSEILSTLALLAGMLVAPVVASDEMTPTSLMFDDATYTAEVEKGHNKLHALYGKALNKSLPATKREKAKRDYFKVSQGLNKKMHSRVMSLNPKKGAALSHTDILLSTHLLLMTADMLSTIQLDAWEEDNRIPSE